MIYNAIAVGTVEKGDTTPAACVSGKFVHAVLSLPIGNKDRTQDLYTSSTEAYKVQAQ